MRRNIQLVGSFKAVSRLMIETWTMSRFVNISKYFNIISTLTHRANISGQKPRFPIFRKMNHFRTPEFLRISPNFPVIFNFWLIGEKNVDDFWLKF